MRKEVEPLKHHGGCAPLPGDFPFAEGVKRIADASIAGQFAIEAEGPRLVALKLVMHRRNVVFPDPDGPMMQTTSPASTSKVTSSRALMLPKRFPTLTADTRWLVISLRRSQILDQSGAPEWLVRRRGSRRRPNTRRRPPSGARSPWRCRNRYPERCEERR